MENSLTASNHKTKTGKKKKLTSFVWGRSNEGTEESSSYISLLEPKPIVGMEVSNPLVSSFIFATLLQIEKEKYKYPSKLTQNQM